MKMKSNIQKKLLMGAAEHTQTMQPLYEAGIENLLCEIRQEHFLTKKQASHNVYKAQLEVEINGLPYGLSQGSITLVYLDSFNSGEDATQGLPCTSHLFKDDILSIYYQTPDEVYYSSSISFDDTINEKLKMDVLVNAEFGVYMDFEYSKELNNLEEGLGYLGLLIKATQQKPMKQVIS